LIAVSILMHAIVISLSASLTNLFYPLIANLFYPLIDLVFAFPTAFTNTNVSAYAVSPLKEQIEASAATIQAKIYNPNYTQIGEDINIIKTVFQNSKAAGKPWQIWAGGTSKCSIAST
jgi:hypothetical protein